MRIASGNQLSPTQNLIGNGAQASARNAITDPYFASVVLLAGNENGAAGGTTFVDQSAAARTLTTVGNAVWSSTAAPTGMTTSIAMDGNGDYLSALDSADWYFTGSVTLEFWLRYSAVGTSFFLVQRAGGTNWQWFHQTGVMYIQKDNGAAALSASWSPSQDVWYAIAVEWNGTNLSLYADGTRIGQNTSSVFNVDIAAALNIGNFSGASTLGVNGFVGPVRITNGVARMNGAASYTLPTLPLPNA